MSRGSARPGTPRSPEGQGAGTDLCGSSRRRRRRPPAEQHGGAQLRRGSPGSPPARPRLGGGDEAGGGRRPAALALTLAAAAPPASRHPAPAGTAPRGLTGPGLTGPRGIMGAVGNTHSPPLPPASSGDYNSRQAPRRRAEHAGKWSPSARGMAGAVVWRPAGRDSASQSAARGRRKFRFLAVVALGLARRERRWRR